MKRFFIFLFIFICISLIVSNCIFETVSYDEYHFYNATDYNIIYIDGRDTSKKSIIHPYDIKTIHDGGMGYVSCFDNDDENAKVNITIGEILFDDSISIKYTVADTFSKNPCFSKNWTILEAIPINKRNTMHSYKVQYTIDEEDYQNALSQQQ